MKFASKMMLLGLTGTLLCLAGQGTAGDAKNPAATASPRMGKDKQPEKGWVKTHERFLGIAKKGGVDVLFLGDSITAGWGGQKAWKSFDAFKPANFGIGGDRTEHVLWRITHGELEGITPKAVVLMIGTNNSGANSAEQIAEGVTVIVKTLREKSPSTKVLLLGVFPRGARSGTPVREKLSKINSIISKLDDGGKTVKYLDIGDKFLQKDGELTKDIMNDYLHLTAKGYDIWAEAITPTLKELLK